MTEMNEKATTHMMNVYHLIVLDESGSMNCVKEQTISGCNETLNTIRRMQKENSEMQNHLASIFVFDNDYSHSRYIRKDMPIVYVTDITEKDYDPCGGTPLYDALGLTLTDLSARIEPRKTMGYVTIITDGYENSSRRYNLEDVKRLIDALKERGVIFSFIGANIDAQSFGNQLHIKNCLQFEQNEAGMREMFARESQSKLRSARSLKITCSYDRASFDSFINDENAGDYYEDYDESNIAPQVIEHLEKGQVFVFGSNKKGAHMGRAARLAFERFGAIMGQAEGLQGSSYAIPTVGVSEKEIYEAVHRFTDFAAQHPEMEFLVTEIGCGAAGWKSEQIAPMFRYAMRLKNVKLPHSFWAYNNGL